MSHLPDTVSSLTQLNKTIILYDGDCLFCRNYVKLVQLKETIGEAVIANIRSHKNLAIDLTAKGYDLDEGMIFVWQNNIYHGKDAIHHIALLSSHSSIFNKINARIFRNPKLAKALYPILRAGRNTYLWLTKHKKIKDSINNI